jgi:hypothetical protein
MHPPDALLQSQSPDIKKRFFGLYPRGLLVLRTCGPRMFPRQLKLQKEIASMSIEKEMKPGQQSEGGKPTFAENAMVTIKILAGFALVGTAFWAVEFWISAG